MAIALVQTVGTSSGTASTNTIAVTVPVAGVSAGTFIVIGCGGNAPGASTACADSKGNTYALDVSKLTTNRRTFIFSSKIGSSLVSGDTVTVTYDTSCTDRGLAVYNFSGLDATTWFDSGNSATGASTSPNSGNVTPANANSLLFGCCVFNNAGSSYTAGSTQALSYNLLNEVNPGSGQFHTATEYLIVSSALLYSANGTITSTNWTQALGVYKASTAVATSYLPILGTG